MASTTVSGNTGINGAVITGSSLTLNFAARGKYFARAEEIEKNDEFRHEDDLRTCISYLDSPATRRKFIDVVKFDSASWLFQQELFKRWIHDSPPTLLTIRGKAFTGKSAMMKKAVDWSTESTSAITLYHFFDDSASGAVTALLQQLLGQLLAQLPRRPWEDVRRWSQDIQSERLEELCSHNWLREKIKDVILDNKRRLREDDTVIRIFVDGIDEHLDDDCAHDVEENSQPLWILEFLWDLLSSLQSAGVDIAVCVSRRHLPFYHGQEPPDEKLELEEYTKAEVSQFLKGKLKCVGNAEREDIMLRLLKRTGSNNFYWADYAGRRIKDRSAGFTENHVIELISAVITNHKTLYEHVLSAHGSKDSRDQLLRLLRLRLGTFRPLKVDEFRHAIAFAEVDDFDKHESLLEWEEVDPRRSASEFSVFIHQASGGLLSTRPFVTSAASGTFDSQAGREGVEEEEQEIWVMFTQHTVEHYLRGDNGPRELRIDETTTLQHSCDLLLYHIGRSVLDFCSLRGDDDAEILEYVLEYWLQHARRLGELPDAMRIPDFLDDDCDNAKSQRFVQGQIKALANGEYTEPLYISDYIREDPESGQLDTDDVSMLLLLSTMGCKSLLQRHLRRCNVCSSILTWAATDAASMDIFQDCLRSATMGQHNSTAVYLLDLAPPRDLDVLCQDMTPLYRACYCCSISFADKTHDQLSLVRHLLHLGADPAAWSPQEYEYPINIAIAHNSPPLMQELLRGGGGGNINDSSNNRSQHAKVAAVLRAQGETSGWTPLHFAVKSPRSSDMEKLAVVKALVRLAPPGQGFLDIRDLEGKTPRDLARELRSRHGNNVLDVLDAFAKADAQRNGLGGIAGVAAARRRKLEVGVHEVRAGSPGRCLD
ncbi:hypothetical protein NHJ13734_008709 [Beauveria thailandica]